MPVVTRNRIDAAAWCFTGDGRVTLPRLANHVRDAGLAGLELAPLSAAKILSNRDLTNGMILPTYAEGTAPFAIGLGSKQADWVRVKEETTRLIQVALQNGYPNVIVFTGYGKPGDTMKDLCVKRLKELRDIAYTISDGAITLCVEHLNDHKFEGPNGPMMGHPGYMGHNVDWVADVVKEARKGPGGRAVTLLFDFYHAAIMHPGQALEKFEQHVNIIGHVHVAQHPGRASLVQTGQLYFDHVAAALHRSKFRGLIGLEYPSQTFANRRVSGKEILGDLDRSVAILTGE